MSKTSTVSGSMLTRFLDRLSSWQMITLLGTLFVADVFFPDPIPLLDEMVLGISTLLLTRWRLKRKAEEDASAGSSHKPPPKNVTPDGPAAP